MSSYLPFLNSPWIPSTIGCSGPGITRSILIEGLIYIYKKNGQTSKKKNMLTLFARANSINLGKSETPILTLVILDPCVPPLPFIYH